jgi:SNF2 family DNA or RNA helicase
MKLCSDIKLIVVTSEMDDKKRGDSIRAFNGEVESDTDETSPESKATVMLADIRDMGKGHNIQAITDIVMWNPPWTVPETDQIIGRAWRGGQTRSVRVWHYVNTGHPLELALYNRNDKQAVVLDISLNISGGDPEAVREELRRRGRYDDVVELDS